jgi:hypothetical protein
MTKREFCFLLGLVGQAGCAIYDDALRRESDAAIDAPRDRAFVARDTVVEAARPDANLSDAEPSRDAPAAEDVSTIEDAPDANEPGDAGTARDASRPPLDASDSDAVPDAFADTVVDADARESGSVGDAPGDTSSDRPIVGCTVDFTVSGVSWDDDGAADAGDGGVRVVRLVGDIDALGAWTPSAGLSMIAKAPGAWSTTVRLAQELSLEFKFVKWQSGSAPEWEEWLPFDSNRSLMVDCSLDGGTVWVDAATETGPAHRAVGRSYGGAFGMKPLDATK